MYKSAQKPTPTSFRTSAHTGVGISRGKSVLDSHVADAPRNDMIYILPCLFGRVHDVVRQTERASPFPTVSTNKRGHPERKRRIPYSVAPHQSTTGFFADAQKDGDFEKRKRIATPSCATVRNDTLFFNAALLFLHWQSSQTAERINKRCHPERKRRTPYSVAAHHSTTGFFADAQHDRCAEN